MLRGLPLPLAIALPRLLPVSRPSSTMAQPLGGGGGEGTTPTPAPSLPPSIIRSTSLSPARPMPSPRFDEQHQHHLSGEPGAASPALLSPSPATTTTTASILLNKPTSQSGASTPASPPPLLEDGQQGLGLRVSSTIDSAPAPPSTSTSPPPPPPNDTTQPSSYFTDQQQQAAESIARPSTRSPSPHCHFAPLPNVEASSRPATRRNSAAQGQAGRVRPLMMTGTAGECLPGFPWPCCAFCYSFYPAPSARAALLTISSPPPSPAFPVLALRFAHQQTSHPFLRIPRAAAAAATWIPPPSLPLSPPSLSSAATTRPAPVEAPAPRALLALAMLPRAPLAPLPLPPPVDRRWVLHTLLPLLGVIPLPCPGEPAPMR